MKKIIIIVFFSIAIQFYLPAQCLPDGITFSTQAQINSFPANYPNCTVIGGTVTISGNDITNLDSLNVLIQIVGGLSIHGCSSLSSIYALSNLDTLGWLSVMSTSILTNFTGLENINYLSYVELSYNWGLTNLVGLNNLDSIGGCLAIVNNESLIDLSGLNSLKYIGSCFDINWNPNLSSLSGLDSLNFIGEAFWLETNYSLTSIAALSNLESIAGSMYIDGVAITSLEGLDNIAPSSISWLTIRNNGNLSNCNVQSICDYLTSPNGTVYIYNNAEGCNSPPEIAASCGNIMPCLPNGDYYFTTQAQIDNFQTDYPNCTNLSGDVTITGWEIDNLAGLNSIKAIRGDLIIFNTSVLTSLDGLDSLASIRNNLYLGGWDHWPYYMDPNFNLVDITALFGLKYVGDNIFVMYNTKLPSLSGLDSIVFDDDFGAITIVDNEKLTTCHVQSVCDHLAGNGSTEIYSNKDGCNSEAEVENACLVGLQNISDNPKFSVYPNPAVDKIFISVNEGVVVSELSIYDNLGRKVLHQLNTVESLDISNFGSGLFTIELIIDGISHKSKLIVM